MIKSKVDTLLPSRMIQFKHKAEKNPTDHFLIQQSLEDFSTNLNAFPPSPLQSVEIVKM